jgi:hypothetical protein
MILLLLNDSETYKVLPALSLRNEMNSLQLSLRRQGEISDMLYYHLRNSSGITPLLYCLPKVHKSGLPLRPIVSFFSSPIIEVSVQHPFSACG